MTTVFTDSFTNTNGTLLPTHGPYTEFAWEDFGNATENSPIIQSNVFSPALANVPSRSVRLDVDPESDEYVLNIQAAPRDALQANRRHVLYFRMSPTGTAHDEVDYYQVIFYGNAAVTQIWKNVSGTRTLLDDSDFSIVNLSSEFRDVHCEVLSSGISVYVDEELAISTTDTEITQRGRIGLGARRGDGFALSPRFDNLELVSLTPLGLIVNAIPIAIDHIFADPELFYYSDFQTEPFLFDSLMPVPEVIMGDQPPQPPILIEGSTIQDLRYSYYSQAVS